MKNFVTVTIWWLIVAMLTLISACSSKPLKVALLPEKNMSDSKPIGAVATNVPDWVNNGSGYYFRKNSRLIYGVAYASPVGDLAQQKSIADDAAREKITMLLTSYLDALSSLYAYAPHAESPQAASQSVPVRYTDTVLASMQSARIVASWRDKNSNSIWSLAELELLQVRNVLETNKSMDFAGKKFFDDHAQSLFDSIASQK
jgi:hypothetical protein